MRFSASTVAALITFFALSSTALAGDVEPDNRGCSPYRYENSCIRGYCSERRYCPEGYILEDILCCLEFPFPFLPRGDDDYERDRDHGDNHRGDHHHGIYVRGDDGYGEGGDRDRDHGDHHGDHHHGFYPRGDDEYGKGGDRDHGKGDHHGKGKDHGKGGYGL
ncbi:hypothetical protein C8R44DRAFT_985334 [Mycena epipterygia]|nr:hypothetical protein C8R44DRAFT_856489 [Mycena epipterygia]KAJ7111868.1 hypothetical protein C8R44DRAFT_985334 [Mycena epipterygia]